jgi:photosystem II stability/assembly factor-like uncharacterized protein
MRVPTLLFLALVSTSLLFSQASLEEIFQGSNNFSRIVLQGESYFDTKYPGLTTEDLSSGVHRDGEFVKFMRWQAFWQDRLNPDGSLGDPSAYFRKQATANPNQRSMNPYAGENWTNINYTDYITVQIGLGRTTSMGFHPTDVNTFYVGAAIGGIWKTTDGGQSYIPLGDELPFMAVSSIIVDQANPNTIYIAISDHVWYGPQGIGVYKSTNGGATWEPTSLSFTFGQNIRIYRMVANPDNPAEMYVAASNGLYKTTDGFTNNSRILTDNCRDVRLRPNNAATVYVGTSSGKVRKSINAGGAFSEMADFGGSSIYLAVTPLDDQKLYARHGNQINKSTNAGETFPAASTTMTNNEVFMFGPQDDEILISGNFETYRSDDDGASFAATSQWLGNNGLPLIHVDQRNMFVNPLENDAVYYCNDGGLYRYVVSTNSFDNLSDGLAITQYYDIAVSQTDANIVGAGSQDNGNVYRQSNGDWLQYAGTGDGMNQDIDPTDSGTRYWEYQNGSLRRWTNGSNSNIKPPNTTSAAWETPFKLDPSNSSRLIAGYNKVFESMDKGSNWTAISGDLNGGSAMNEMAIAPSNGERIYVTSGGNLYVKSIFNDSWTTVSLPGGSVSDIEVDPVDMDKVYVSTSGFSSGSKVYVSSDAGANWENISGSLPNVSFGALELFHEVPGGVFVGSDAGVFYRDDQLDDWLEYGDLPNTRVEDIEIQYAAGLIRVGTHGRGVLEASIIIETCTAASADGDNDGVCDLFDFCPALNNNLIGLACDDGDAFSSGELYDTECGCSGGQANLDYCFAEGSTGTGSDYITNVELNGIDNGSGKSNYSDFRSIIIPLEIGETYTLNTGLAAAFDPDRVHAWVDWDRNGVFDEDELIDMTVPVNRQSNGSITVPANAAEGAVTMRVRVVYSTTLVDPCGSAFGEVEDYTISVSCGEGAGDCAALPLEWAAFTARGLGKGSALLNWSTAEEENVSHFRVERSYDGLQFTELQQLQAQNIRSANYEFLDETARGNAAYYRITSVDFDGAESQTQLRRVTWLDSEAAVRMSPNPVGDGGLRVQWTSPSARNVRYVLYNSFGQEIRKVDLAAAAGARDVVVPTADLPAGLYLLRLRAKDWDWTGEFVVR